MIVQIDTNRQESQDREIKTNIFTKSSCVNTVMCLEIVLSVILKHETHNFFSSFEQYKCTCDLEFCIFGFINHLHLLART